MSTIAFEKTITKAIEVPDYTQKIAQAVEARTALVEQATAIDEKAIGLAYSAIGAIESYLWELFLPFVETPELRYYGPLTQLSRVGAKAIADLEYDSVNGFIDVGFSFSTGDDYAANTKYILRLHILEDEMTTSWFVKRRKIGITVPDWPEEMSAVNVCTVPYDASMVCGIWQDKKRLVLAYIDEALKRHAESVKHDCTNAGHYLNILERFEL